MEYQKLIDILDKIINQPSEFRIKNLWIIFWNYIDIIKKIKVDWNFSNHAPKPDLKETIDIDTSKFAKKIDLADLKSDIDDLYIDKLKPVSVDLTPSVPVFFDQPQPGENESLSLELGPWNVVCVLLNVL